MGDRLLDLDYSLSVIGVHHRTMEVADAYYMIQLFNDTNKGGEDVS